MTDLIRPQLSVGIRNFAPTPPDDWRHVLAQARAADEAGIDRVFVSDHLVFGRDLSDYGVPERGGTEGGRQPTGPDGDWLEALTVMAAMGAVTDRVLLATNILVAPLRRAVVLAKGAATIDALSHGRFELGVGVGWQEAEYRAAGVEFSARGRLLDEQLAACRALWTQSEADFIGDGFSMEGIHMMPKPARPRGVPIWIGGRATQVAARRLAHYGAGWIPWGVGPDDFLDAVRHMRELVAAEGAGAADFQVAYPLANAFLGTGGIDYATMFARVPELFAAGVTDFRTLLRIPPDHDEALEMFSEMVAAFAAATDGCA